MKSITFGLLCSVVISALSLSALAQRGGGPSGRARDQGHRATQSGEQAGQSSARVREAEALNGIFARMQPAVATALARVPGAVQGLNLSGLRPAVQSALNSSRTLAVGEQQVSPRALILAAMAVAENGQFSSTAALGTGFAAVADTEPQNFDAAAPGHTEALRLAQLALGKQVQILERIMNGGMQITPDQLRDHERVVANTLRHFNSMGSAAFGNVAYLRAIMDEVVAANGNKPVTPNDNLVLSKLREIIACQ